MGSGHWFKTIIKLKKGRHEKRREVKGSSTFKNSTSSKWKHRSQKEPANFSNSAARGNRGLIGEPVEDIAATRIQTAFRAFMARRKLRCLKGIVRLQVFTQRDSVTKQASTTLNYLHSWSAVQAEIRARRLSMVTEGKIRQKKLENQLKLEARLHDLEVEWCGGSETKEETLARIQQREEAAVKRERAMAYAFSHQWRANSNCNQGLNTCEIGKANWGWSWIERWIAARPWEPRVSPQSYNPKKRQTKQPNKVGKTFKPSTTKVAVSGKVVLSNGEGGTTRARRLSCPLVAQKGKSKVEEAND